MLRQEFLDQARGGGASLDSEFLENTLVVFFNWLTARIAANVTICLAATGPCQHFALFGTRRLAFLLLNLPRRYLHDADGVPDHIGGAFLALVSLGHMVMVPTTAQYAKQRDTVKTTIILAVAAVSLCTQTAYATTPKISGSYLLSLTTFCQAVVDPWPDGTSVLNQGDYVVNSGIYKFDATTGTVSGSANGFVGSVIVPNATGGQLKASPTKLTNVPYSNTSTTLTIGSMVQKIVYGSVVAGIVQQFTFYTTGTENSATPNCITNGTASHT